MKTVYRILLVFAALIPGVLHYLYTGPALWSHNSSAAFNAWLCLWVVAIVLPIWALLNVGAK